MSDTPRTDMLCRTVDNISIVGGKIYQATIETVDASFARQLEHELTEALGEIKGLRRLVNDCHIVAGQLETERNDARAEIERLNKNMRFATAINLAMREAGQDLPDLRGHECQAKHKLLSLFDFWRKKVRPRLPGFIDDEISQRDKLIEQMRETLELVKGVSSSLPSFFFDAGEDKDGNECESIYECVCDAIKAAKGGKMGGK